MQPQLKRGMLEACVLSVLFNEDSYGYKIIKDIGVCMEISESTLYPVLKRLEAAGFVTVYPREHNGRLRKYYSITPSGRIRVQDFLVEWKMVTDVVDFIKRGCEK